MKCQKHEGSLAEEFSRASPPPPPPAGWLGRSQVEMPLGMGSLPLVRGGALLQDDSHMVMLSANAVSLAQAVEESIREESGADVS